MDDASLLTPWRELYGVHPAAELFPPLSGAELADLANDIKERGILMPILAVRHDGPEEPGVPHFDIVDGRSRLDAMARAGLPLSDSDGKLAFRFDVLDDDADPYAVAVSANLKRRHLNAAQRRAAIGNYVAARPEQSDRQIAKTFKVDHTTVGAVRKKGEATGEIPPVERTVGADGKSRPVKRKPTENLTPPARPIPEDPELARLVAECEEIEERMRANRAAFFAKLAALFPQVSVSRVVELLLEEVKEGEEEEEALADLD